jgi:hypothetical protein
MTDKKRYNIRGIDVTENQYRVIHEAQYLHDKFCESVYDAAELACKESQKNLDAVWKKVMEEGYAK